MTLNITIQEKLIFDGDKLKDFSIAAFETLKQVLTYKNPKFIENEKWGYSNFETPKHLYSFTCINGKFKAHRGCLTKIEDQLKKFGITVKKIDRTLVCESVSFNQSNVVFRPDQNELITELTKFDDGCATGYTSMGKTLMGLGIAQILEQPLLVIVHSTFIQEQWIKEATDPNLFNLDKKFIGGVGGVFAGKKRRYGKINICLYHSLSKKEHLDFFKDKIGIIIFDEGQKSAIDAVQNVVNNFRAKYRYSVSASFKRNDGKQFLIFDTFGPIRFTAVEKDGSSKILSRIRLIPSKYEDDQYLEDHKYTDMITRMSQDKDRNVKICRLAVQAVRQDKLVLILVERKAQAGVLAKMLSNFSVDLLLGPVHKKDILELDIGKKAKQILIDYDDKTAYDRIEKKSYYKKDIDIIIGTQKAEVGLNLRTIDHVIVTTPAGNNDERFTQIKGRPERTYSEKQEEYFEGKKEVPIVNVIVDYKMIISRKAGDNIKEKFGKYVTTLKRKKK